MAVFPSPERLARFSTRRPWTVVGLWGVALVLALVGASRIGSVLTTSAEQYESNESIRGNDLLEERLFGTLPVQETIVVQSDRLTADDAAYRQVVEAVTGAVRGLKEDVANVTNTYEAGAPSLVSEDGRTTIIPVTLVGELKDAEDHAKPLISAIEPFDGKDGFTVVTGGDASTSFAFTEASKQDLEKAEIFGIPAALLILLVVFGALVAAGIPIVLGVVSIIVALGISAVLGQAFELSTFLVNFVTTMGLAVGIDYSLIITQRFREERRNGLSRDDAIVRAGATASRAVLFSGIAVIVALCGMIIVPQSIFRSLGVGAVLVVAAAVVAALTLLPAVLRLLGDRVNGVSIRLPRFGRKSVSERSFWDRTTAIVMRHPVISVAVSVILLVGAALPYATITLGWAGVSSLPEESEARRAFEILNTEFSAGVLAPTRIVVDAPDVTTPEIEATIDRLVKRLGEDGTFGVPSVQVNDAKNLALITVPLTGEPQGDAARDAVLRLRDDYVPGVRPAESGARIFVTGVTAEGIDGTDLIERYTIPVFAFVLGLSFIILLVVFRSIVVPIKAMIMNLLSVGAAYGLMVLIFQHGVGNELFGFSKVEGIETWVPLFMFATLFGLSMDYHVFLLTRIRERFEHTGNNAESVAYGVRSTAGMITGAAAIMVAVFGGFASGQMVAFQQMGFGLAVAVFIDATIVRSVLVPASMELLGDRNWYLPAWLNWLPKVDVEGSSVPAPSSKAAPPILPATSGLPGR